MISCHKCRYCSNAFFRDCEFEIKDMNKDVLIYCEAKKKLKQNINRINKCKNFNFNPLCVVTMEEFNPEKPNRSQEKMKIEWVDTQQKFDI